MLRLLLAALALSLAACKDAPPPAQAATPSKPESKALAKPDPNAELAIRIRRALEDAGKIDAAAIDIAAADGVVTLFGTAGTKEERSRAGQVAAKVDGVKSVENKLVIVRGS